MFSSHELENILFLDIETATITPDYDSLSDRMRDLWDKKSLRYMRTDAPKTPEELFAEKGGIHAEFGKVVCISCGVVRFEQGPTAPPTIKLKSYYGSDEKNILDEFGEMLNMYMRRKEGINLCAHNGKEFDYPYLGRRYVIQGLPLPDALQLRGKKPWEVSLLDTMELWKFGDYKSYTSLELLAAVLDIPSPKDDIDGSQISQVFWEDQGYERIKAYCEKDVFTTAQIVLKMSRLPVAENLPVETEEP